MRSPLGFREAGHIKCSLRAIAAMQMLPQHLAYAIEDKAVRASAPRGLISASSNPVPDCARTHSFGANPSATAPQKALVETQSTGNERLSRPSVWQENCTSLLRFEFEEVGTSQAEGRVVCDRRRDLQWWVHTKAWSTAAECAVAQRSGTLQPPPWNQQRFGRRRILFGAIILGAVTRFIGSGLARVAVVA